MGNKRKFEVARAVPEVRPLPCHEMPEEMRLAFLALEREMYRQRQELAAMLVECGFVVLHDRPVAGQVKLALQELYRRAETFRAMVNS